MRTIAKSVFLVAALALAPLAASAQDYPSRPITVIMPFAGGSASDVVARILLDRMSKTLGQPMIVENKPGAGGNIATEQVARATPDGYTLLVIGANNPINTTLYDKLSFDLLRDFAAVAGIYRVYQVMEVNPSFPAKTVAEFVAYAKAHPGKVNFGSAGTGSVAHVSGEYFKLLAGVDMQHVPYRGAPLALADLLSGQVQVMFDNLPSSIEHVRTGKLRALAVTTAARSPALPDIPTLGDFVPGFEASVWQGIGVPKSTPPEIVEKLNKEINAALSDPRIRAQLANLGSTELALSPAEFGTLIAEETEKWARVIRKASIKAQ
jgi:tripartite-type tricarboxylate transporter receptor subunit TctC